MRGFLCVPPLYYDTSKSKKKLRKLCILCTLYFLVPFKCEGLRKANTIRQEKSACFTSHTNCFLLHQGWIRIELINVVPSFQPLHRNVWHRNRVRIKIISNPYKHFTAETPQAIKFRKSVFLPDSLL